MRSWGKARVTDKAGLERKPSWAIRAIAMESYGKVRGREEVV